MLKEIFIENYKSLKNTKVEFKDGLNIIIGKNGSGKSNLLEFIDYSIISLGLPGIEKNFTLQGNYNYTLINTDTPNDSLKIGLSTSINENVNKPIFNQNDNSPFTKKIKIEINRSKIVDSYNFIITAGNIFSNIPPEIQLRIFSYVSFKRLLGFSLPHNITWLNAPNKYIISIDQIANIDDKNKNFVFGSEFKRNLEVTLWNSGFDIDDSININEVSEVFNGSFREYVDKINLNKYLQLFSTIQEIRPSKGITFRKIENEIHIDYLFIEFKINNDWVPWSYLSDGTKRLFYLISEISSQNDGLILIEEPELGVHPHQLYKLMQFIREQSATKQIIVSTHSPIVLDCLDPDELDRITIAKIANGSSHFDKMTEEERNKAGRYMKEVGELSYYWLHSDLENDED